MRAFQITAAALLIAILAAPAALAQQPSYDQQPGPPTYGQSPIPPPYALDSLVSRIALYPDPLLAQILAAATFPDQIPEAARYADEHHYLTGDALAQAIVNDRLPWDPSVQALIPFPSVLDTMASDPGWTQQLGEAFMASQPAVMDAVQRMRHKAYDYGYLRSNNAIVVSGGPYIDIEPVNPGFIIVPTYNPAVVYYAPRAGFYAGGAIGFGFGVSIGPAFRPWGWGGNRFGWGEHHVYINRSVWNRTYVNRNTYIHQYPNVQRYAPGQRVEQHQLIQRNAHEREAQWNNRGRAEEHGREGHDSGHRDDRR